MNHRFDFIRTKLGVFALLLICLRPETMAQGPALGGFVFAHAVATSSPVEISAGGAKLLRQGMKTPGATGALGMTEGDHQIQVTAQGCEPATGTIKVTSATTPLLVAYAEKTGEGAAAKTAIRLLQLPSAPQKERYLTRLVWAAPRSTITVRVNGRDVTLEAGKAVPVEGSRLAVTLPGSASPMDFELEKVGSHFLLIHATPTGGLSAFLATDETASWR